MTPPPAARRRWRRRRRSACRRSRSMMDAYHSRSERAHVVSRPNGESRASLGVDARRSERFDETSDVGAIIPAGDFVSSSGETRARGARERRLHERLRTRERRGRGRVFGGERERENPLKMARGHALRSDQRGTPNAREAETSVQPANAACASVFERSSRVGDAVEEEKRAFEKSVFSFLARFARALGVELLHRREPEIAFSARARPFSPLHLLVRTSGAGAPRVPLPPKRYS